MGVGMSHQLQSILKTLPQFRMRAAALCWGVRIAVSVLVCWVAGGSRDSGIVDAASTRHPPIPKAWFDARGVCVFPLSAGALPQSRDELNKSLLGAWSSALALPDPAKVISIEGGRYPAVESLRIDVSDGTMHTRKKEEKLRPDGKPQSRLGVGRFEFVGEPLLCDKARLNVNLSAEKVRLDLEHDRSGRPILLLADAQIGKLTFEATPDDLARVVLATAKEMAAPYGVDIVSTSVQIEAQTPRSVTAKLHISTRVGFIPAGMAFKAHVDIDDSMNARLTGLTVDGDEALGPLIVGLLRPGLSKYEGKTRPLISFPSREMHLHDLQIRVDDSVHLTADFGN